MGEGQLLPHGSNNSDDQLLAVVKVSLDLFPEIAIRQLDIVLGATVGEHQVEKAIVNVDLIAR